MAGGDILYVSRDYDAIMCASRDYDELYHTDRCALRTQHIEHVTDRKESANTFIVWRHTSHIAHSRISYTY